MSLRRVVLCGALVAAACRPDTVAPAQKPAEPPVSSPGAIPDAPLSGTIHGAPFVARDMRYTVDERVGYAHTDIRLSTGQAENACGPISPERPTSVWLRLEGADKIVAKDVRLTPDTETTWSVHYQVFDDGHWIGLSTGNALLSIRGVSPDGRVSGGLAVCFGDDSKSCVSGSFDAPNCPANIDQPVRGTPAAESIPKQYLERMTTDAGARD